MKSCTLVLLFLSVMHIQAQAPSITSQPINTTVVLGQSVRFDLATSSTASIQWYRDYEALKGATASSYAFVPALSDGGHVYSATAASDGGVAYSSRAWLHVTPRMDLPTVTDVEDFGTVQAAVVADSFGLGVDSYQDWEFAAVAAMGGKWVRTDGCNWEQFEVQLMPGNTSGGFAPEKISNCVGAVTSAYRYGLHLNSLAYWAPPQTVIATATSALAVPAGSTELPLLLTSGTLAGYEARAMLIAGSLSLNPRIDAGAPVDAIAGNTVYMAEKTVADIPAGTALTVSVLLYPPVLLAPQSPSPSYIANSSVQAWTRYVFALESYMQREGVTGAVELWNEPERADELWDYAPLFYTTQPPHLDVAGTGSYLAFASASLPTVKGVKLLNGWTNVSGSSSLYNSDTLWALPAPAPLVNSIFLGEAIHPYGNNPEQTTWLPKIVLQDATARTFNLFTETPIGEQVGANFKAIPFFNAEAQAVGGIKVSITETGIALDKKAGQTEIERTRFDVRQFLSYAGLNVYPIIFYKAGQDPDFAWFGEDDAHTPLPVVGAFRDLLSDIRSLAQTAPIESSPPILPVSLAYSGYYPLATTSFIGVRSGESRSSILFYSWQKSYAVPNGGGSESENYGSNGGAVPSMPLWVALESPHSVALQIRIPSGFNVSRVQDVVSQQTVPYTKVGNIVTYPVADNPIEVMLTPSATSALEIRVAAATANLGDPFVTLEATVTYASGITPTPPFLFTMPDGATLKATCISVADTTESCTTSYAINHLAAGSYSVTGSIEADAIYALVVDQNILSLLPATPALQISSTSGSLDAPTTLLLGTMSYTGSIAPTGLVRFQLGPSSPFESAACTGIQSPLQCKIAYPLTALPAGAVQATMLFAGDANYRAASSLRSILLTPASAIIRVSALTVPYGIANVELDALISYTGEAAPVGPVSFVVGSEPSLPARCIGSVSPLNCSALYDASWESSGSHIITCSLASDSSYSAAASTGTLTVAVPEFTFTRTGTGTSSALQGIPALFSFTLMPLTTLPSGSVTFDVTGLPTNAVATFTSSTPSTFDGRRLITMSVSLGATSQSSLTPSLTEWPILAFLSSPFLLGRLGCRRGKRMMLHLTLGVTCIAGAGAMMGCGTNSVRVGGAPYTLTVTAISGLVQHSQTVTLTINE